MTVLLGNSESRSVYKNFHLDKLNENGLDYSHYTYQKYLQYNKFIPPGDRNYFVHTLYNNVNVPTADSKGQFNLFPLDLTDQFGGGGSGSGSSSGGKKLVGPNVGIVSSSPLKLEIELSPIPTLTWYIVYTFVYLNRIDFSGSKHQQDVTYEYIM